MSEYNLLILIILGLLLSLVFKISAKNISSICFLLLGLIVINELGGMGYDQIYSVLSIFLVILAIIYLPVYQRILELVQNHTKKLDVKNKSTGLIQNNIVTSLFAAFVVMGLVVLPLLKNGIMFSLDHSWPLFGFNWNTVAVNYIVPLIYNPLVYVFGGIIAEKIILIVFFVVGGFSISCLVTNIFIDEK